MCGIVGVFSDLVTQMEQGTFDRLLVLSSFRGEHSTGLVKAYETRGVEGIKYATTRTLQPSPRFVYSREYEKAVSNNYDAASKKSDNIYALIGHTRHATKGEITVKNAHPFTFSNLIGVHNGTIKKSFKGSSEFGTDSEAFYSLLNECDDITEALNEISDWDTAYAFVWVDKRTNKVHIVRNDKRPLYFTFAYQGRSMFMASTREMLDFVCKGKTTFNHERKYDSPYFTLKANHLMTFELGESPFDTMVIDELQVKPPRSSAVTYYGSTRNFSGGGNHGTATSPSDTTESQPGKHQPTQGGFRKRSGNDSESSKGKDGESLRRLSWLRPSSPVSSNARLVVAPAHSNPDLFYQTIEGVQFVKGFEGKFYRESEIRHHLLKGCMCCGQMVDVYSPEFRKVVWFSRDTYICNDCLDQEWVQFMLEEERKAG